MSTPRISDDHVDAVIKHTEYHVFENTTLTVCVLTLQNGFNVTGEAACVDPENFDAEMGETIAFNKARQKVWELEGYLLKDQIHRGVYVNYPV